MIAFHRFRLPALLLALLLSACATAPAPQSAGPPAAPYTLLLVSLDGVHPDDLDRGDTPNLARLAADGVQAEWMVPSYPTLTFPNHYTLVTGLRPDRHGIVHNSMLDAELGRFALSNRDAVGEGRWWSDGEPIWVTAENAGLPTATLFWPGSEAPVGTGGHPPAAGHALFRTPRRRGACPRPGVAADARGDARGGRADRPAG